MYATPRREKTFPLEQPNNIKWDGTRVNIQSPFLTQYSLSTAIDTLPIKSESNQYFL
jgi:hypothetical protein